MIKEALKIWNQGIRKTMTDYGVTQGIMMFIVAAILLAVMLPVLNGVMTATPTIVSNANDVGGNNVLGASAMNSTQVALFSSVGSSYGLLIVVLILISAAVIIGAIGLFRYFGGQE
jgi:hypothetical protein